MEVAACHQMNAEKPGKYEWAGMVQGQLSSGEHVIWFGQPLAGRCARKGLFPLLLGIPWTILSIYIVAREAGLVMSPMILMGLVMVSVPFWMHRKAKRTLYVLTNRRALLLSLGWRGKIQERSFWPQHLTQLKRKEMADGSGDLVLAHDRHEDSEGGERVTEVGFLAIPQVRFVEAKLRTLLDESCRRKIERPAS